MSVPRFQDVLNQIVAATTVAINNAGITTPGQVGIGNPVSTEIVKILNNGQSQVSVFDRPGTMRSTTRYPVGPLFPITNPTSTLFASVANPVGAFNPWTINFSGDAGAGAFVVVIVGSAATAATYQASANESLATTIAGVCAAINTLGLSGISASVMVDSVLVAGSPMCTVSVSGTGAVLAREVNRTSRSVQVTVWTPNPTMRFQISDAIEQGVGTIDTPFLTLSDGTPALCVLSGGAGSGMDDDNQSSYSMYIDHFIFEVEYGILKTYPGIPIQTVTATIELPAGESVTVVSG